jgi:hypothetical protein
MTSPKKVNANRVNAKASTGPKSVLGKAVASSNATSHGILSRELLLPHENRPEFEELLSALITELGAVGTLERTLVERIAVAIWRQRRLVRAERQDIQKQNDASVDAKTDAGTPRSKLMLAPDAELLRQQLRCEPYVSNLDALQREVLMLQKIDHMTFQDYPKAFPLFSRIFPGLNQEEASKPFAVANLSEMYGSAAELQAKVLPAILAAQAENGRLKAEGAAQRNISTPSNTDSLARYQAALDNEWYKAMRAFREARQYRLRTLESVQNFETNPKL